MKFSRLDLKFILLRYLIILLGVMGSFSAYSVGPVQGLGFLSGRNYSEAVGISADGKVVVGESVTKSNSSTRRAFKWTPAVGMTNLGGLGGDRYSAAYGVNADGTVVVGVAVTKNGATRAFRWSEATNVMESLEPLNGGSVSWGYGVNADGTVVVGGSNDGAAGNLGRAFRWSQATGKMENLGTLNNSNYSQAYAVNADGSVVVGESQDGAEKYNSRAFYWTSATNEMISLGTLNGGIGSAAYAVNADGSVVVGESVDGAVGNVGRAFRWTSATGMVSLGTLNGGDVSRAYGVNADGTVVVGEASNGAEKNLKRAFRWTEKTGMQTLESWLGMTSGNVPAIALANAVSADGSVVVGTLENGEAFIACKNCGLISFSELDKSLEEMKVMTSFVSQMGSLVLHGANGYPLSKLLSEKEDSCAWMTGDWGSMGTGSRSGLAEVGTCHRFNSHLQVNVGVGKNRTSQRLNVGGKAVLEGNYALVQMLRELPVKNLWLTLSGFYQGGKIDNHRGYMNAGQLDSSSGDVHTTMPAIRSRLDWNEALSVKKVLLTPYVEVSHWVAKVNAYTENGGGFPAVFDERKEFITESRIGIYGRLPLLTCTTLLGRLEGVHRFQKNGAPTTGELVDLFSFDIPGQDYQQNWLRGSLGINHQQDQKIASLMLHATTHGQDPKFWVSASYAVKF